MLPNPCANRFCRNTGPAYSPLCYTGRCTCDFLSSLRRKLPSTVLETAIYTRNDGVADWRYCMTGDCKNDFEVPVRISVWPSTHPPMPSSPSAWPWLKQPDRASDFHDSRPRARLYHKSRKASRYILCCD